MYRLPVLAVFLLLSACLATNPYAPVPEQLGVKVRVFEDVVRWGDLRKMYVFAQPGSEVEIPAGLDTVRVTHYEVVDAHEIAPWRWAQTAVINYVLTDRQVVRQLVDEQVWASDDEGKTWYRDNPPPHFR
jgi:hypothetical protein